MNGMRAPPRDLDEGEVAATLAAGWGVESEALDYVAIGGGSHHWIAHSSRGRRWVTVDDLEDKGFLGRDRDSAWRALDAALRTAAVLQGERLEFVLAPMPTSAGDVLRPTGAHYATAVYPYIEGNAYDFHQALPVGIRDRVLEMLARLHRVPAATVPNARRAAVWPSEHGHLERALQDADREWTGGPFSEPARETLQRHRREIEAAVDEFGKLAAEIERGEAAPAITHGEPHPGNLLRDGRRLWLIDWDTVALATPERDLWSIVTRDPAALGIYEAASHRRVDPAAIRLYQLRWPIDDAALFTKLLRAPHCVDGNTEHALQALRSTLENLPGPYRSQP